MTQLGLFKATMAHQPHDKFLWYAEFSPDLRVRVQEAFDVPEGQPIGQHLGMFEGVWLWPMANVKPWERYGAYHPGVEESDTYSLDQFGVLRRKGDYFHFTHTISPLRNAQSFDEIKDYPFPTLADQDKEALKQRVDNAHAQGLVAMGSVCHIYENAWQIRGYEQFLMDMAIQPDWCEYILDRVAEYRMDIVRTCVEAGVDMLHCGDDVANQRALMFSYDQWAYFMKPRWAAIWAEAKRIKPDVAIRYHSDGDISSIIPDLIDIGVDILNPIQPECLDPHWVKKEYGDQLVLDGTIGTQTVMPFGTPDEVRARLQEYKETLGADGAIIFAPTHMLEPEVPIENIRAMVETLSL